AGCSKTLRCQGKTPRRIQGTTRNQSFDEMAASVEHTYEAVARSGNVILFVAVLFRIGYVDETVDISNSERSVAIRERWINEAATDLHEILIVDVHCARVEIRYVKAISTGGRSQRGALVDGSLVPVVNSENSVIR